MVQNPQDPFGSFRGVMSPSAEPARRKWFTGVEVVPKTAPLGTPDPSRQVGILEGRFDARSPLCLSIGQAATGYSSGFGWPASQAYKAGLVNVAGVAFGGATVLRAACVLEYGSGSQSNRVAFDWAEGSYNLPPCEFVRVSVLVWGTSWPLNQLAALATVAEGKIDGAMVPVQSSVGALSAGVPQSFAPPSHARAFEVLLTDPSPIAPTPVIAIKGGTTGTRDYATKSFFPAWSPLDIAPQADNVSVVSDVTCAATVRWYLAL
jgi:hypothetical protein